MAKQTTKMVLDTSVLHKAFDDIAALPSSLNDVAQNIYSDFLGSFFHFPKDFFICAQECATPDAGDGIFRFSIGAPKLEILTAALTALKVGLELTHAAPPDSNLPECNTVSEVNQNEY